MCKVERPSGPGTHFSPGAARQSTQVRCRAASRTWSGTTLCMSGSVTTSRTLKWQARRAASVPPHCSPDRTAPSPGGPVEPQPNQAQAAHAYGARRDSTNVLSSLGPSCSATAHPTSPRWGSIRQVTTCGSPPGTGVTRLEGSVRCAGAASLPGQRSPRCRWLLRLDVRDRPPPAHRPSGREPHDAPIAGARRLPADQEKRTSAPLIPLGRPCVQLDVRSRSHPRKGCAQWSRPALHGGRPSPSR